VLDENQNQLTNLAFKHGQRDHVTTQQVIILGFKFRNPLQQEERITCT